MGKAGSVVALAIAAAGVASCDLPRDPGGATRRVERGVLRVGLSENPPWATHTGADFGGIETELASALAARFGAKPVWTVGPESRLVSALERGDLDLVIGGFTSDSPWAHKVAITRPHAEVGGQKHVLLAPPGENRWLLTLDSFIAQRERDHPSNRGTP
jgi:polar amino acid transport system substrate-binding protein